MELRACSPFTQVIDVPPLAPLEDALVNFTNQQGAVNERTSLQNNIIGYLAEANVMDDYVLPTPSLTFYHYLAYDALVELGLAICDTDEPFFSDTALFDQLKRTEFKGASGFVSMDRMTGT